MLYLRYGNMEIKKNKHKYLLQYHIIFVCKKHFGRRITADSIKEKSIGQGLPELTPVEIVDCEVNEAGSPLVLDNG